MTAYTRVDVTPDTPEWEEERRLSIGASEVAAIMGLDRWQTALDVYKAKHGAERDFDPLLAFIGHKAEPIIEEWVTQFSGVPHELRPGFMARSIEFPFLHASFDRTSEPWCTWQFKTANEYSGHHWDDGVPTDIRVQVQAEMVVAGTQKAAIVVWIGGREFRLYWENRDTRFIEQQMIPALEKFWADTQAGVAPQPQTLAENAEMYPSIDATVEASDAALEAVERRAVLLSDIEEQQKEADALKLVIANYMGAADTLTYRGRRILTYKSQAGRVGFDMTTFKATHPDLHAKFTTTGAPFKVMRTIEEKK